MKLGFAKEDITPRVGVELCGFGPFRCRHSIGIRDRLWARAMAVECGDRTMVVVSCDLVGTTPEIYEQTRQAVHAETGVDVDAVLVNCSHTHSGPCTGPYAGWGEPDPPYVETLPQRIAAACVRATAALQDATLAHAEAPCEGIGQNREYDRDALPTEEVLAEDWRPNKPELTDTTCHVLRADAGGRTIGFVSYFGCHPVVCCAETRYIHGDYCGVATNTIERENDGAVGLFLQGAQGDVNACVVHKPEQESLLALDIVAARYASAVRNGLRAAQPMTVDDIAWHRDEVAFTRKPWGIEKLRQMLAEIEARVHAPGATDASRDIRMDTVYLLALRHMITAAETGESLSPPIGVHGMRLGPIALLGSPFETFQAIKNEVVAAARSDIPLVLSFTDDSRGYAPDHTAAERGGYAADTVPLMCRSLPFANIHEELVKALLGVERGLY